MAKVITKGDYNRILHSHMSCLIGLQQSMSAEERKALEKKTNDLFEEYYDKLPDAPTFEVCEIMRQIEDGESVNIPSTFAPMLMCAMERMQGAHSIKLTMRDGTDTLSKN